MLFAGVFFCILSPTKALATIKVQQGTTTITSGNTSTTASITAINDINRAFLLMWSTGDSGTDRAERLQCTGYLSSTTQITFEREEGTDDCQIGYFVVEAENEEFEIIERGTMTIAAANTTVSTDIAAAIDQTRSFIVANSRLGDVSGNDDNNHKGYATVHFVDNDTIMATRGASGTYSTDVRYEVIQWHVQSGVTVQSKEYSASIGASEVTDTIDTAVTTAQTWLYATWRHTASGLSQMAVETYLRDSTSVGFQRYTGTYSSAARWWAIEFPSDVVVQHVSGATAASSDLTVAHTISAVTVADTWADFYNDSNGTGQALPRHRWHPQITNTTTITATRYYNGQLSNQRVQAIDTNAWSFVADETAPTNPDTTNGWDVPAKTNALTDNTWQNSHNTAYFEWSGASDTSGVSGYSIYFGTDSGGEPGTTEEQSGTSYDAGTLGGDGIYYLRVRTFDIWGNYSNPTTLFTVKYDATAPSSNPTAPANGWHSSSKITSLTDDTWQNDDDTPYFEWSGADDAMSGVSGYSIYFGTDSGGEPGTTQEQSTTNYTVASATGIGTFYLRVRTFDAAGNYSADATLFTFKYDDTNPTNPTAPANGWESSSKITSLTDNTPQNGDDTPYFEWSGAADSDSGVSGYSIYFGTDSGGEPGTTQEQTGISYDHTVATGESTNYLRVRTFDNAGNYSTPITLFTFIYDTTKPTVTLTIGQNPTGAIAATALSFQLQFTESMDTGVTPTITYDPIGATGAQNVGTSGAWSTTTYTNDTYTAYNDNAITSSTGDGAATISMTLASDVAGNVMDADTDDTLTIDTVIDHFKIEHDAVADTNVWEEVTISAKTQYGANVDDYTGTITMSTLGETGQITWRLVTGNGTFNDGGGGDDSATYTYDNTDDGVVVVEIRSNAADSLDLEVTDGTYNDDESEPDLVVGSKALDYFIITHDNAGTAGVGETITITAYDTQDNVKTDYVGTMTLDTDGTATTISWALDTGQGNFADGGASVDTATYTYNINDAGVASFTFTDTAAETVNISATDGVTDDDSEGNMVVGPAGIDHFIITHDNSATAGINDQITVTAKDQYSNTKDDYTDTITLDTNGTATTITWALQTGNGTFVDGGASADTATYTYVGTDNGVAVFNFSDTTTESVDIDSTADGKSDDDSEGNMVVNPDALDHFIIAHDTNASAGVAEAITVTAYDQYNNTKTNYTGTATLDTNGTATTITWALNTGNGTFVDGGASVDTATYTYDATDNGVAIFDLTDTTEETIDVDASDGGSTDDDSEGNLVVGPPVLSYFVISHDNAANAGVADAVTVTAKDSLDATLTNYTGTITLDTDGTATTIEWALQTGSGTFNDGGASVDTATYTYVAGDSGVATFTITDNTVENIDIDVSDAGKVDDESEGQLIVGNPILSHFIVSHDEAATAGTADNVTITAIDTIDATKTDYTGTITVDTNTTDDTGVTWALVTGNGTFVDGGASVDTATYTYDATDNGVVTLSIVDNLAESIDIDVSGDGKTDDDSDNNLVVSAASLDHFVIGHDNSALVSIAESVTVTAKDLYENTLLSYTGTITLDTDGTATTITWALQSGNGTFVDGGASVDTATYTYDSSDNGAATFTITNSTNESVNISAADGGTTDDDTEGNMEFATASDIFVDNEDGSPTYTDGGSGWSTRTGGTEYGSNWRRDSTHNTGGWARWTPDITVAGNYNVSCMGRSPEAFLSLDSPFTVYYDGGNETTEIDQQNGGNPNFDLLGAYRFLTGTAGYVQLDDTTVGALDFSADVCKWELKGIANAAANATPTTDVAVGSSNNVILDFTVTNQHSVLDTVTSVTVNRLGTAPDSEIAFVKLFYDSNNSNDFTEGVDTEIGSGTFSSGTRTFSGLNVDVTASGGTEQFFVIYNIDSGATDGNTIDAEIPADGVVMSNAGLVNTAAINSTGSRTLDVVLDHFEISHDNAGIAGLDENITITAKDAYGNTVVDYTGTINLDTTGTATTITWGLNTGSGTFVDGGASVDTATYTYSGADNGVVILTFNDTATEVVNIDITGDATDDDTEGNITVSAGAIDHFVIAHDNSAVAGSAENVTVTAKDAYENTIVDYTSEITLDTNGTATSITWALLTGNGTFADGGASVDTATYTYADSDDGVAVFTITDTTVETLNISVSGDSKTDDDTEGNLVVDPAALDHFVIGHDTTATAGSAENITITAIDSLGNTKTDYTGTITMDTNGAPLTITWALVTGGGTFVDGGASVDTATYTYTGSDNGVVTLSINDTTAETIDIDAVDGGVTDDESEGNLVIAPAAIDYFIVNHDNTAVTGISENVTVTAYDTYDNTKTDYTGTATLDTDGTVTTITWSLNSGNGTFVDGGSSVDTATYTFDSSDNGTASFYINDTTAENIDVDVSGDGKTDDDSEGNLDVVSSGLDHFEIVHDNNGINGQAETITITAKNANEDTVTTYAGTMTVDTNGTATTITWALDTGNGTFVDGGASVDTATYTFVGSDNGVVVLTLTDTTEETINISASAEGKNDDDTEGNLVINPVGLHHFRVSHDNAATAGTADTITITAEDANDNAVTDYTSQITVDTNGTATAITWAKQTGNGVFVDGGSSVDTATYTYDNSDNGVVVLTITDTNVETINISVSGSGESDEDSEGNLVVTAGAIDHFVLTHDGNAVVGTAENITVTAKDAYENTVTDYTGTATMDTDGTATTITWALVTGNGSFLDGGASVDTATYTFSGTDNGIATLSINDSAAETLNISATDGGTTDDDTEGSLVVGAGSVDYFVIGHDNSAEAGVADNVTVTAYDSFDNVVDDYTGTITMNTNGTATTITWALVTGNGTFVDGGASVDTATYTFDNSDNGVVTLSISDTKVETIDIDTSGDGKTDDDTEGNMTISPTVIDHFILSHDNSAIAGTADNVTITAYDTYSNLKDDYTGTATMDTNGTATTITWALVTGNGTFVDGGASVDTATYTFVGSDNGAATLSISDTLTETIDIDAADGGSTDDDTEGTMVINPAAIEDFVVAHDGQGVTNSAEPITVTARDLYQNTKTDYTGTITASTTGEAGEIVWSLNTGAGTFVDNGGGSDSSTYTYHSSDSGVVVLNLTDDLADTLNVAISGDGKSDEDSEGNLVISSDSIVIDNLDSGYTEPVSNTWSNNTNGIEYSSNWRRDNTPGGGGTARWTPNIAIHGNYEVSAYWTTGGGTLASDAPYTMTHIGGPTTVDVNQDANGNAWNSLGTFEFETGTGGYVELSDDANDDVCADAIRWELKGSAAGVANAVSTDNVIAGEADVVIGDFTLSNNSTTADTITDVTINELGTISDSEITTVKLYYDSNNSGDYTVGVDAEAGSGTFASGTITFSSLSISLPGSGTQDLFVVLKIANTVDDGDTIDVEIPIDGISFTNAQNVAESALNSSGTRTVALSLHHFVISHDTAATAGAADNVTVTAKDQFENTLTNYTGTMTLDTDGTATTTTWALDTGNGTFVDGGASVDTATYTYAGSDNGVAIFDITANTAESLNISATDGGQTDDDTEGNLVVAAAGLDHFVIGHDTTATVGTAENITVTAKDAFENTIDSYTGTITLDTTGTATTIEWGLITGFGTFVDGGASVDTATYTFVASDNSTATFSITDNTAESVNISAVDGGTTDDDTEGNLVISASGIDHFVISHDNSAQAGVADNVNVTAKDQFGNTITDYTGTITMDTDGTATSITWAKVTGGGTFVDNGPSVDTATYTYVTGDSGVVILSISDITVENINISVSGDSKTDDDTEGTLNVGPGVIDHFEITHDSLATQSVAENITIDAYDAYGNIITDYTGTITVDTDGTATDITWALVTGSGTFVDGGASVDTATYTYVGSDNGSVVLSITDDIAENINISVSGDGQTDDDTEGNLEVAPAGFHHFTIIHDNDAVVSTAETVTIEARDATEAIVTNYTGTITVDTNGTASTITWALDTGNGTFVDGGASVDTATYTYVGSDNGVVVLTIDDTTQEAVNISVSGSGETDDDTEGLLTFHPAGLHHFVIAHDNVGTSSVAENVTITAEDANDATVTDYTGTITVDTDGTAGTITWALDTGNGTFIDGGAAVDTATYTYVGSDNGVVTLTITDDTAESINISATGDGKTDEDTEGNLIFSAGGLDHFVITHDSNAEAGVAENITITAKDAGENTITDYTGTITVDTDGTATTITWALVTGGGTFVDGGASVDTATYTYVGSDNGVVTLSINDTVTESLDISVSGDSKTDDNTAADLVIAATALDHFVVSHDNAGTVTIAEDITITAYDTYSNIKTNYAGTITVDTNGTATTITWALDTGAGTFVDGGASVDTATYTYNTADNGVVVLDFTDTTAETVDIDVSGNGKFDDDTEGNMVIASGGLDHFVISHDSSATAGVADNVTITAKDIQENTITDYTGTITVDTDGTATTITWALVTGGGTFVDGGASVDTATYTFIGSDNGVVTLSINDTTTDALNISVSGDSKFDDDTEGTLTVNPDVLDNFIIAHDNVAIQSVSENVTVTARDQYNNTKTDYTGTMTLDTNGTATTITWSLITGGGTFVDGGASVDTATYTYAAGDSGVAVFGFTDSAVESVNISATDGGSTDEDTEGDLDVQASSSTVDGVANTLTSNYVGQDVTDHLILDVKLTNNDVVSADTLESVTIDNAGTIPDADVTSVKLYSDSNNSDSYTSGVDTEIASGTFSSGTVTFSSLSVSLPAAGSEEIYVIFDLDGSVTDASTLDAEIPINGLIFTSAPDAESAALNSSGLDTVDSVDPTAVTGLSSTSHANAISAWNDPESKDDTVAVSWTPSTDATSGLDGYSVLWDTNPTTLPDAVKDIEEGITTQTSSSLADGTAHYFHIRSLDNAGNWDDTAQHLGPFYIDTTAPTSPSIYSISEYAGGDFLYVSDTDTIYYSGLGFSAFVVYVEASDALAGLNRAVYPATVSGGATDSTPAGGAYEFEHTYTVSSPGSSYSASDITVYDNAGNSVTIPFDVLLDDTPPSTVTTLTSSSHTVSVSSDDDDIIFTWTDVTDADTGLAGYSFIVDESATTDPPTYNNVSAGVQTYTETDVDNGSNHYAHIRPVDNVGNWGSTDHDGPYVIGRGALSSSITSSSSTVSTDQDFTVTMNVSNSGNSTVSDVDPSTLTVNTTGGASATTVSDPASQNISEGSNKNFQWTYTVGSSSGTLSFTGNATGTDSEGSISSTATQSPDVFVEEKANLTVSTSTSPSTVNTSQNITISVTFTNTGEADATGVVPSLTPSGTGSPTIDSGPSPASATVAGGGSQIFTYTAHGTTSGTATFTADISSGTDENSGDSLTVTTDQDSVTVNTAPSFALVSSIAATPTAVNQSGTITVTMTVENTGTNAVDDITPSTLTVGGTSSDASIDTGPTPSSISSLAAGASTDIVWTYTAGTTLGTVNFTGNAVGTEASSSSTSSDDVTIQVAPAALSSSIAVSPSSGLTQSTITVTMTVDNTAATGGASANSVEPSTLTLGGTSGEANLVTGPTPTSATIDAQDSQDFVWTYKAGSTAGTVNFTGNASGVDANSSASISSSSTTSSNVSISTLSPAWTYPTGTDTVGPIRSVPVGYNVITDRVYFGSDDNNIYMLDGTTQALVNTFTASGDVRGLPYPSTELKGADLTDIIYFGTLGNSAYSVWADNTENWSRVIGESITTAVLYDYVSSVFFGTTSGSVYSISSTTGSDVWVDTSTISSSIEAAPAQIFVPTLSYDEIYFGANDGIMYAFNAADGTGGRTFDTGQGASGSIKTAPLIVPLSAGNILFFGTSNGRFYAVNTATLSSAEGDTGWATNPFVAGGGIVGAPWHESGFIYFGAQDGKLYALDAATGLERANFPINVGSPIESWPIVYDGVVYFGADNGKFYAADVNSGEILPGWPYDTGGAIKGGASLHQIFDEFFNLTDVFILIGSDSGKLYSFEDQ